MLAGDNSILRQATTAREKSEISQQEEKSKLTQLEAMSNLEGTISSEGVKILAGFAVASKTEENTLEKGLVMVDSSGNEYVWIEVPNANLGGNPTFGPDYASQGLPTEKISEEPITDEQKTKIETALINYVTTDLLTVDDDGDKYNTSRLGWKDEWYSECGISDSATYNALYKKMLKSVYNNEGFWIGRYEAGTTTPRGEESNSIDGLIPLSKPNLYPINYVTCAQAQTIASRANSVGNYSSSLMFGIQWDCVLKYLNKRGNVSVSSLISDSSSWGNYGNSEFELNRGEYNVYDKDEWKFTEWKNYTEETEEYVDSTSKKIKNRDEQDTAQGMILTTTGASETNKKQNIYDLAGNIDEWTLERPAYSPNRPSAIRGGEFDTYGADLSCSSRGQPKSTVSLDAFGFRITLY